VKRRRATRKSGWWISLARRLYDEAHIALWAGLVAFLIMFGLFVAPNLRATQAAWQAHKDAELSAENDMLCRRWNFVPGTNAYRSCLDDLQMLRASIDKRRADEIDILF
jgi:hypothetical protein